jgi:succinoglycan biosynthesis transport protein ExoP
MQTQPADSRASVREENIDVRRYLVALRRSLPLMVALVTVLTGLTLLASMLAPKRYSADAQIIVDPDQSVLQTTDAGSQQRQLATLRTLVDSPTVLAPAAQRARRTEAELENKVSSTVDQNANLITVSADDGTAAGAAEIANAVARSFVDSQAAVERARLRAAQAALTHEIDQLQANTTGTDTAEQIRALRERGAQLRVAEASAGANLQIARGAQAPKAPSSPRPLRNTVLALFASIFLAILVALGRDQLRPRVANQRELAQLLGLPVLATLPERGSRVLHRRDAMLAGAEQEGYRSLSAGIRLALPADREHVLLVSSAMHAEGKTTIVSRLGRQLAQAGHPTLLVSADLRWPRLDAALGVEGREGLSDLLARQDQLSAAAVRRRIVSGEQRGERGADVLPAGGRAGTDAATLLGGAALGELFAAIGELDYTYVLVDAPPLLGIGDTQLLASHSDELLVVSRLESLKLSNVLDLREMLDRVAAHPLGVVVIGGDIEVSPYYSTGRSALDVDQPLLPR